MKLNYSQLEMHLAKQFAPLYLISTDDIILKRDALQLIRKAAKQSGFNERIRITPHHEADWEQFYTSLYSTSFFSEKSLLELDLRDTTLSKSANKILQEYIEHPSAQHCLVIDIGKLDEKITKSTWYKAIEKSGIVVIIWPITREQLPQWIQQRVKRYKLQIEPAAAHLLSEYTEGNLAAAAQAIEKIYLLRPSNMIDTHLVNLCLMNENHFTVFDLVDSLLTSNLSRSLHILETLKNDGIEPAIILWSITRELRMLAELAQQLAQGKSYEVLFQKQRIFSKRQPIIRQFLQKYKMHDCLHYLSHLLEIDRIIKGALLENVWDSLQIFCLKMTRV